MSVTVTVRKFDGPRNGKFWHGQGLSITGASFARVRAVLVSDGRLKLWLQSQPGTIFLNGSPVKHDPVASYGAVWVGNVDQTIFNKWTGRVPPPAPAAETSVEKLVESHVEKLPEALPGVDETVETVFSLVQIYQWFWAYVAEPLPQSWGEDAKMHIRGIVPTHGSPPNIRIYGAEEFLIDPVLRINGVWVVPSLVDLTRWSPDEKFLAASLTLDEFSKIILAHDGSPLPDEPTPPRTRARVMVAALESGQAEVSAEWAEAVEELNNVDRQIALDEAQLRLIDDRIEFYSRARRRASVARYRKRKTLYNNRLAKNNSRLDELVDVVAEYEDCWLAQIKDRLGYGMGRAQD